MIKNITGYNLGVIVLSFFIHMGGKAQEKGLFNDSLEIGIVEHIGETIPLDLSFRNEKDSVVILRDLINKPTILNFVYFDCPGICSPLLSGITEVVEKSDLRIGEDYQVMTISFDYHDNPVKARQKKANFLKKHGQKSAGGWMYLTGDSVNIYKIVKAVGFKYKKAGVDFIHPAAIMAVSPHGKLTRYLYGVTFLPLDFKMAVYESQQEFARPGIAKTLLLCYAYDPVGKRYVLDVLKVSGTIIIFILVLFVITLVLKSKLQNKKAVQK